MDNSISSSSDRDRSQVFGQSGNIGNIDDSLFGNLVGADTRKSSSQQLYVNGFEQHLNDTVIPLAQIALRAFEQSPDFASKMNLAFGDGFDRQQSKSKVLIDNLAQGKLIPIEILPSGQIQAKGAFGENKIYLSEDLFNSTANPSEAVNVLLEEMGHYIDSQINAQDSAGDEGEIFAKLVQNQHFQTGELSALQAEDDRGILNIDSRTIAVEHASLKPGVFAVDATGKVLIDFLADSGSYRSEMAIFSLNGMENLVAGSTEFIQEAARRSLSNSVSGYVVINDPTEGAKFTGDLGESNKNDGKYTGVKSFSFTAGDNVAMMLVPQGTIQDVFNNPQANGNKRPLFSMADANPNQVIQLGQLGAGTFGWEDLRIDRGGDADYNDIIFKVKGAVGETTDLGGLVAPGKRWQDLPLGQEIFTAIFEDDSLANLNAKLAEDTGTSNSDTISFNPEVVGKLGRGKIEKFQAKFTEDEDFVDILAVLKTGNNFTLDREELARINGGQLTDGYHKLTLQAEYKFGNKSHATVEFILDTHGSVDPNELSIDDDTDQITNNPTPSIMGKGENGSTVRIFNGNTQVGEAIVVDGMWKITTTELSDGEKNLTVKSIDPAGNYSQSVSFPITIDTIEPDAPTGIKIKDSKDNLTNQTKPIIVGKAETGTKVQIFDDHRKLGETTAVDGAWEIPVSFRRDGVKNLTIQAIDLAGNISDDATIEITIDSHTPEIHFGLLEDTGASDHDGITGKATIIGTISDASSIEKFQAKLNNGAFVDVLAKLNPDGSFSLDLDTLTQINGGQLPDGIYQLSLQAEDRAGNITEEVKLHFTLDTSKPPTLGFMLDTLFDSAPVGDALTTFAVANIIGQTEANATVTITETGASITADAQGKFKFTNVALVLGDNSFTVNAIDLAGNIRSQVGMIKRVATDNSDVVLDWNANLLNAVYEDKTAPPVASRNMAIVQSAVFDAVNSFAKTYKNYHFTGTAPTGGSVEAAAASAAYNALVALYPQQKAFFDNALIASLSEITDGAAEDAGVAFGKTVAEDLLSFRSSDGANPVVSPLSLQSDENLSSLPVIKPGDWQPTAPAFAAALLPKWGTVKPFGLTSGSQFRPAGAPALTSDKYTAEFNQVKELGSINSTTRTAEQTQIARFWADGTGTFTPPGHWNQIAQKVAATKGNSLVDNARLFALLDISLADAGIAAWDAKYQYSFWRPITAIQQADTDGNPNTIGDPNWKPLLTTPPFPEYVSGHSTFSSAAATVLTSLLGDNIGFDTNSFGTPGVNRQFTSFNAAATEAGISRIYGGIHFDSANIDGQTTGKSIGNYVLNNLLGVAENQPPVDTVKPVAPTEVKIKDDVDTLTNLTTPIITGKAETGTTVQIFDGVTKLGEAVAVSGMFEIPTSALTDGVKNLTVKSIDLAGNISDSTPFSLTVDTVKPVAPTEVKIKDDVDTVTNLKTPIITGKAETGTTVQIFDGVTKLGEAVAVNGAFEIKTSALTDGVKNLTVKSIDLAGNISDSTPFSLTVDTTVVINKPVAPTEIKIKDDVDTLTNLTTPIITGKATTGTTVQIFDGVTKLGEAVAVDRMFAIPTSALTDGVKNLTVKSIDLAGNISDSTPFSLTVDTVKPVAPTEVKIKDDVDTVTNLKTPIITGKAETGTTVQIFDGVTKLGEAVAVNGAFEIKTSSLTDGVKNLTVKSIDLAGNISDNTPFSLTVDTLIPTVNLTTPAANAQLNIGAKLQGTVDGTGSAISKFSYHFGTSADIIVPLNAQGQFDVALDLTGLTGKQSLVLKSVDVAGNTTESTVPVTVGTDVTPPKVTIASTPSMAVNYLELTFDEPVTEASFVADKYSLKIVGGTQDGIAVTIASIQKLSTTQVRVNLAAPFGSGKYQLAVAAGIADAVGNATTAAQTFDLNIAPARLTISPANGEEKVGLTRDTVVNFGKKIDPTTVNSENFYLIANGQRLAGKIKVSSTEEFATFFYDVPLPSSTEVRVVVDTAKILGRDGVAIDGDGDGKAGGIATADFTTLPLTRIKGTDVWGYVYDSYNKNADGSNIPLKGVTIRLDSLPDVFATTDEKGYFILKDVPAPDFFVYIDGAKATGSTAAAQYASLGKPFHSVPGQSTQLIMDGTPFNVYLPPMAASDVKPLSATETTKVGFGEAADAFLQKQFPNVAPDLWKEVKVTFAPGSAQDDAGNKATQATIIPVDPTRLPAPLPPGANPKLIISIQAGGAGGFNREALGGSTNFDVPAPIQFPNLEGLKPGEKSLFWSFDHDAGKWIVIGTGTVSADGKTIISDPGVGVIAPGWHFTNPGVPTDGPPPPPPQPPCLNGDQITETVVDITTTILDCAKELTGIGKAIGAIYEGAKGVQTLYRNARDLSEAIDEANKQGKGLTAGEVQKGIKLINDGKISVVSIIDALKDQNPISKALAISKCVESALSTLENVCGRITKEPNSPWSTITVKLVCLGLTTARATLAKVNGLISKAEDGLKALGLELVCKTIGQLNDIIGAVPQSIEPLALNGQSLSLLALAPSDPLPPEFLTLLKQITSQAADASTQLVPLVAFSDGITELDNIVVKPTLKNTTQMFYDFEGTPKNSTYLIEYGTFEARGTTDGKGQFSTVLPPNTAFKVSIFDVVNNRIGTYSGTTGASGVSTKIPPLEFISAKGLLDTDGEGLVDFAEKVVGTSITKRDTDGDGINDFAALQQGLNPLGGTAFPTGIIASLPLQGEAKAVVVEASTTNVQGQTAYIATGSYGLAVVNATQFDKPIILGQLNLPGDATDVSVDAKLNIAAVAAGSGGLHLVNVADGMLPTLKQTINLAANKVEIADGIAYATVNNILHSIDLSSGQKLESFTLPGSGTVTGLAREGTKLYAFINGSKTLSIIDISVEGAATLLGQLNVNISSSAGGLSVGNGVVHLAERIGLNTIDVSTPSAPKLISGPDANLTAVDITLNGSGLALVAAETQGLGVYSTADPQKTDNFLTQIDTPGNTYDAAVASGIAFVADGSSGLQVVNYLPFDNKGVAPTININTSVIDLDPNTTGIQVQEGSNIPLRVDITDDVQVRNVELLVDGNIVSNDVSFPWDFSVIAPKITAAKTSFDIQVRATDTGGNIALSNLLTLNLSTDKFAPTVIGTTPTEGARPKTIPTISIKFNEAIDPTKLTTAGVTLTNLGQDGVLGGGDDIVTPVASLETRSFDKTLVIQPTGELPLGNYQLKVDASIISDRVGNSPTTPVTVNFTKRPLTSPLTIGAPITGKLVQAGDDQVYTFTGTTGQRLIFDTLLVNGNIYAQLTSPSGSTLGTYYNGSDGIPLMLTEAGTYKVTVSGGNTTGDYSFRFLDGNAAPTITLGTTVTESLVETILEKDVYQINGKAGERLFFDSLSKDAIRGNWVLYGTGNQYIAGTNLNNDFETVLPNDGTYLLLINRNTDSPVAINYSFKVTNPPTTTAALTLGTAVTSTIAQPGEQKEYTFTGAVGQRLFYDGLANNTTSLIYAQLISPSGVTVFGNGDADIDRAPLTLTEAGTYKVVIDGYLDNIGDYSFKLIDAGVATAITLGETVTRTLTPGLETNIYRITGTKGQQLYIDSLVANSNATWILYDQNDRSVDSSYNLSDFEPTLTADGTYLLVIDGRNASGNSDYSFKVTNSSTTTTALTIGTTVTSTITLPGEQDIYTFTGTAGQRLLYDGLGNNTTSTIYSQLISPSGQNIFYNNDADTDRVPLTLKEAGTYKLVIDGNQAATGDYSFKLIDAGTATAITLGETVTSNLTPGIETDIYQIAGTAGQKLYLDSLLANSSASWTLYSPTDVSVAGTSLGSDFNPTLTANGTYLLVLDGRNTSGNSNYSFKVTNPGATTTALTLGTTITSNISQAGEEDIYTFTGTVGQRLYYDGLINNNTSTIYAQLVSPSGQIISYNTDADSDREPVTLTEAGTYKVIIEGASDNTGNYSFRLIDAAAASTLSLNTPITGTLDPGLKTEIYRINGTAGQKLKFDSLLTGSVSANWKLYNSNNQVLVNNNLITDFTATLPNDGTYLLMLDGSGANGTVNYNFNVTDVSEATVAKSGFNTLKTGTIAAGGVDTYTLTAPAGSLVYFDSQTPDVSTLNIEVRDPLNQYLTNLNTSGDSQPLLLNSSGNYTVTVKGSGPTSTGSYSFQAIDLTTAATALTLSTPVTKALTNGAETVVYKFTGSTGQKIYYDALQTDTDAVNAQLIGPTGTSIFNNNSDSDSNLLTLTDGGTYYLLLKGNSTTAADYSFNLIDVSTVTTVELAKTVTDKLEPGLKTNVYRINGTIGQRLYLDSAITTPTATGATWALYSPTNQYITQANVGGDFETKLTSDGTYYLVLDGSTTTGNIDYSFTVTNPPTTTTALTLGTAVTSTIAQVGEVKEYTFTGAAGQRLYYDALINNITSTINAELISPSGQSVFYRTDADTDRAPFTLSEVGTYKIIIDGSGASIGDYSFKLIDATAATAIVLGDTVTTTLTPGLETEIYRITGTAGQQLYLDSLLADTTNAYWTLYDQNNQTVVNRYGSGDLETTLTADGTYLLVINGYNANGNSDYSFKVTNSITTTTALTLGTTTTSTIAQVGEQDIYTFTGAAGQRLLYDALINNVTSTINAQLISPSGQNVLNNNDADIDRAPFTLTESGTYKLVLDGYQAAIGDYSFRLVDLSAATPVTVGTTITDTLTPGLETDVYQITATAGQKLYVDSLSTTTNYLAANWILYSPSNQSAVRSNLGSDLETTLTTSGTYYLVLDGATTNGNVNYSFKVTNPPTTSTPLALGTTITSSIAEVGEVDEYTFTGAVGQRLYYDLLTNITNYSLTARLVSPSGQSVLTSGYYGGGDGQPITLTEAGNYRLIIDGTDSNIGDYSFRLLDTTIAPPVALDKTVTSTLNPGVKTDVYRVSGKAGQKLRFDSLITGFVSSNWSLYGVGNQYLGGTSLGSDFEVTLPGEGDYLLVLNGAKTDGTVDYKFQVTEI